MKHFSLVGILLFFVLFSASLLSAASVSKAPEGKIVLLQNKFETMESSIQDAAPDFTLAADPARPEFGKSLKIYRSSKVHNAVYFPFRQPAPEGHDITVSCDYKGIGYVFLLDAQKRQVGGVICSSSIKVINGKSENYQASGLRHNPAQWLHLQMHFKPAQGVYSIKVTDEQGNTTESKTFTLASENTPVQIKAGNAYPIENVAYMDNLLVYCDAERNLFGRKNVLSLDHLKLDGVTATGVAGGNVLPRLRLDKNEARIVFTPETLMDVSLVRFRAAEGMQVHVLAVNAGGQNVSLATAEMQQQRGTVFEQEHKPISLVSATIAITGKPGDELDALGLWTPYYGNVSAANREFAEKLGGDFRLAAYEGDAPAVLLLYNKTDEALPVTISLSERRSKKEIQPKRDLVLQPGENPVEFEIRNLPDGEFLVTVTEDARESAARGSILRLLRRQQVPDPEPPKLLELAGKKLYFPDDWQLESSDNIRFCQGVTEAYHVTDKSMSEDAYFQHGAQIGLADGKLHLSFYTVDRGFSKASQRDYIATSDDPDRPARWQVRPRASGEKVPGIQPNPLRFLTRFQTAKAQPGADGKEHWRLYNPETDGAVDLTRMEMHYIPSHSPGKLGYSKQAAWEGIKPLERTTWPVWHKRPGQSLLLAKNPLLEDGYPGDLEEGFETNDNFGGQWVSDDGKEFFLIHGRVIRRYEPLNIPYDNLSRISRLMTVFRTRDGIHYSRAYMALPVLTEQIGTQHYGATPFRLKDGGPICALVSKYFAGDQRFCCDLAYSWDGFKWKQFPGSPMFLDNTPPGTWCAGNIHPSQAAFHHNGKLYWLLNWQSSGYHFYGEMSGDKSQITADAIKKRFAGRGLENWPLFKYFDYDYEKLAEDMRRSRVTPAVMILRKDGFFYAMAGELAGTFMTRPIRADGKISVNAKIASGGNLKIQICRLDGTPIAGAAAEFAAGDYIDADTGLIAPQELFKIKVQMKDASLYTIGF